MNTVVYVLFVICIKEGNMLRSTQVNTSMEVFAKADRCIRNIEPNKKTLQKECDTVSIECKEKKLNE